MTPDPLQHAWQAQGDRTRLVIDADRLHAEVRRNRRWLTTAVFWRDVREVGVALLLVPVWIVMGVQLGSPWTWYLTVPAHLWVAGFLLADRLRHRRPAEPGEPLVRCVEASLAQVEQQIWLLRNIFWWYLLPPGLTILAFFGHITWDAWAGGRNVVALAGPFAAVALTFAVIYWANQAAVRSTLEPRRQELLALLASLQDPPASSA